MEPMWRPPTNLPSFREEDAYLTWGGRALLWLVVFAGGFLVADILLWGPGPLPKSVNIPIWVGAAIVAVIGVPPVAMLGVAWVHLIRADIARRREARDGRRVYTGPIARWFDMHGFALGLAIVGVIVSACIWWQLHEPR